MGTADDSGCAIDSNGIGGILLGMTLGDARGVIRGARLERASDGDGAALVAIKVDTTVLLNVHAGEDDAESPIDWTKKISFIETFHTSCTTVSGINPGALVADVERRLGTVVRISESEIESRQHITFDRQPAWLTFRIDYTGILATGSRETTSYRPEAKILSISISRRLQVSRARGAIEPRGEDSAPVTPDASLVPCDTGVDERT
jgi:hypothetical protein